MNDAEFAAAIQDACKCGATISAIKCFVESIRRDEREACAKLCEDMHDYETTGYEYAEAIRARSNN